MTVTPNRLSSEDSKKVLCLYIAILKKYKIRSALLIISGFGLRAISIVIFVLILRIFMNIIEPAASLESINRILLTNFGITTDEQTMLLSLLGGLSVLILIQFLTGKINLWLALDARARLLNHCLENEINNHRETNMHIAIDHIPPGYDAVIKSSEILLFYVVLLICIFYMSSLMGLSVLLAVPMVLTILLIKGRKEVFITQEFRESRKSFQINEDEKSLNKVIKLSNESFSFPVKDLINSQMISSATIVVIMITFMMFYENFEYQGLGAMLLVFSIRYSLIYAAELSRFLNRLLKQRTVIDKVHNDIFK